MPTPVANADCIGMSILDVGSARCEASGTACSHFPILPAACSWWDALCKYSTCEVGSEAVAIHRTLHHLEAGGQAPTASITIQHVLGLSTCSLPQYGMGKKGAGAGAFPKVAFIFHTPAPVCYMCIFSMYCLLISITLGVPPFLGVCLCANVLPQLRCKHTCSL